MITLASQLVQTIGIQFVAYHHPYDFSVILDLQKLILSTFLHFLLISLNG